MNYYGNEVAANNQNDRPAVLLTIEIPHSWTDTHLKDCLNYKLQPQISRQTPVIVCKRYKKGKDNEFYVELLTRSDRDRLMELNNTEICSSGHRLYPRIEPWFQEEYLEPPSHKFDRYYDGESSKQRYQHRRQSNGSQNTWGNIDENSKRNRKDDHGSNESWKRQRTSVSPLRNNNKTHTGFLRMRGLPFSASKDDIYLFFKYYNPVSDSIVLTYGSDGLATGEAYVQFESAEDSERAMDLHCKMMGKRYIELFLSNKEEHGRALVQRPQPKSRSETSWSEEYQVFLSKAPESMLLREISAYINSFFKESGVFDRDIVIDASRKGNNGLCVFRCISPVAAQKIVDELNDVPLKKMKLKLSRHRNITRKKRNGEHDNLKIDDLKNSLHNDTASTCSSTTSNLSSPQMSLPPSSSNQKLQNTDTTNESRFVLLSSCNDDIKCLSKIMSFLDDAIIDESYEGRTPIVGAERNGSSGYRLETDTAETASKLVGLSGTKYKGTIVLTLRKDKETNPITNLDSTSSQEKKNLNPIANLDSTSSQEKNNLNPIANLDSTSSQEKNNLTQQILKLLKENRDLKKKNEELITSGSQNKPIELEESSDEEDEGKSPSQKSRKNHDEMVKKLKAIELERDRYESKSKQLERDLLAVKDNSKDKDSSKDNTKEKSETLVQEAKKQVPNDYEHRMAEIHESWREQTTKIQELQETIERLKAVQDQEATEKENLKQRYSEMTDALVRASTVICEERSKNKSTSKSLDETKKANKRLEKELRGYRSLSRRVKTEDDFDV